VGSKEMPKDWNEELFSQYFRREIYLTVLIIDE
jgi:hypothetical protein